MNLNRILTLSLLALALTAPGARAFWAQIYYDSSAIKMVSDEEKYDDLFGNLGGFANAFLSRLPGDVSGRSFAFDCTIGADATAHVETAGWEYRVFKHVPPGVGEVELLKRVEGHTEVEIVRGDAAASSVGFAHVWHEFDGSPHTLAHIYDDAVGATSSSLLATLNLPLLGTAGGVSFGVPVNVHLGRGTFTDDSGGLAVAAFYVCPVNVFQIERRVSGRLHVYANADAVSVISMLTAKCKGQFDATAEAQYQLLTHDSCPE